jgi:hypothetical protein
MARQALSGLLATSVLLGSGIAPASAWTMNATAWNNTPSSTPLQLNTFQSTFGTTTNQRSTASEASTTNANGTPLTLDQLKSITADLNRTHPFPNTASMSVLSARGNAREELHL